MEALRRTLSNPEGTEEEVLEPVGPRLESNFKIVTPYASRIKGKGLCVVSPSLSGGGPIVHLPTHSEHLP
jgi:hypothetical protein